MRQATHIFVIQTQGQGLVEFTAEVAAWLAAEKLETGLLTLFCRHTSASLLIQENADPGVQRDIEAYFSRLAPEAPGLYIHDAEGPDDMPSHLRAALTAAQLSVPILSGKMALGTWQGLYLFEHRRAPHQREIVAHLIGA